MTDNRFMTEPNQGRYRFISDAGHGWLEVPLAEIKGMKFSTFSYRDDAYAYLEEDCDAPAFMRAKGLNHEDLTEVHVDEFNRSNKWRLSEEVGNE